MDPLRVLHLTTELPHPMGVSGGSVRQFRLFSALAQLGAEIVVVAPVTKREHEELNPEETLRDAGVRLVATPRRARRELEAAAALVRRPSLALRASRIPIHGLQTEMLAIDMEGPARGALSQMPDVVTIEHDYAISLADLLPASVPKVLTLQNVTPEYYRVRAADTRGVQGLVNRRASAMAERYISARLGQFRQLIAVSDDDARLVRKLTSAPVSVIPNGTDTAREHQELSRMSGAPPTVLFTGTMNHPPNHEGALWFHREIWPLISQAEPEARLVIVGRQPQEELMRLAQADPRVEVTGAVPDMAPYYERATVAIAPLRSGSGTRLKILDAFAARRPVVSTTIGCEGLEVSNDEHLLIADDPRTFAARTLELLGDEAHRARLADAGRRLVAERYDWSALAAQFEHLLRSAST